jgi:hypothetical protein
MYYSKNISKNAPFQYNVIKETLFPEIQMGLAAEWNIHVSFNNGRKDILFILRSSQHRRQRDRGTEIGAKKLISGTCHLLVSFTSGVGG